MLTFLRQIVNIQQYSTNVTVALCSIMIFYKP